MVLRLKKKYVNVVEKKLNYERGCLCKESLFLFCNKLQRTHRTRDHSGHYTVQYLEQRSNPIGWF